MKAQHNQTFKVLIPFVIRQQTVVFRAGTRLAPDEQIAGLLQESLASRDAPMQDDRDQRSQADLLTINPAGASKKKSLELHGRPSFAKPARAVSPSVDALADQAIDARHVNVICFL